jgi:anaerobic selenocysteine-containing dehydrogenase
MGYTEPEGGSDIATCKTRAVRDGDGWIINGQKMFTSGAHNCRCIFSLTNADPNGRRHRSLTVFLAPTDSPRLEIQGIRTVDGERSNITYYIDVGTCVGRNGTLTAYLIDAVNLVAGKLDQPGGSVFSTLGMPGQKLGTTAMGASLRRTYRRKRTRVGGFRAVIGSEPGALMAKEISTPGDRQIKALFVSAGNPVLSVPDGDEIESALDGLGLMVGLDLYVTETTAHCDYILPVTTMYERDDFALTFQTFQATPFRQATEAVVAPAGQARTEWDIISELVERMGRRAPVFAALGLARKLTRVFGRPFTPRPLVDGMIRMSAGGDRFGLRRGGLTFRRLTEQHPHGVVVAPHIRTGVLREVVAYPRGRVRLEHDDIKTEIARLSRRGTPEDYPMRVIGMREPRSENSWLHNAPLLMRGNRIHRALMRRDDATRRKISDGDTIAVRSPYGRIALSVSLTAASCPARSPSRTAGATRVPAAGNWPIAQAA